jgi:hypothetical protein
VRRNLRVEMFWWRIEIARLGPVASESGEDWVPLAIRDQGEDDL